MGGGGRTYKCLEGGLWESCQLSNEASLVDDGVMGISDDCFFGLLRLFMCRLRVKIIIYIVRVKIVRLLRIRGILYYIILYYTILYYIILLHNTFKKFTTA